MKDDEPGQPKGTGKELRQWGSWPSAGKYTVLELGSGVTFFRRILIGRKGKKEE